MQRPQHLLKNPSTANLSSSSLNWRKQELPFPCWHFQDSHFEPDENRQMSFRTWILLSQQPTSQRLSTHRQDSSNPAQKLLKPFSFCTILSGFLRDIRPIKDELWRSADRKAHAGRDSKPQSLLRKCSPNSPPWLTSCRPRATSTGDAPSVVPPARAGPGLGRSAWNCPVGAGSACAAEPFAGGMKVPAGVSDDLWLQTRRGSVTWECAGYQSQLVRSQGGTGFLLTKIYCHVLLLGGRKKAVRNLQERALGPGSRDNSFSAKLSFTTARSFFQEEVMEQLVMKSPPQPRCLTPLASQWHQVQQLTCHQLLRPFRWTNCIMTIYVHSDSYSEYFSLFSQCFFFQEQL